MAHAKHEHESAKPSAPRLGAMVRVRKEGHKMHFTIGTIRGARPDSHEWFVSTPAYGSGWFQANELEVLSK